MKTEFHYEIDFELSSEEAYADWISRIIEMEDYSASNLTYIFCDDSYLLNINKTHLNHDTLTDIITFDYTENRAISGDIFISVDRVKENAINFRVAFDLELRRVMSHGVLHLIGYNDKLESEKELMREKENQMMELFHVEL